MVTFGTKVWIIAGFYAGCLGYLHSYNPTDKTYVVQAMCIPKDQVTARHMDITVTAKEMKIALPK